MNRTEFEALVNVPNKTYSIQLSTEFGKVGLQNSIISSNVLTWGGIFSTKLVVYTSASNATVENVDCVNNKIDLSDIVSRNYLSGRCNQKSCGLLANKPASIPPYFQYFATDLSKPIYWTGTDWVDATGATV